MTIDLVVPPEGAGHGRTEIVVQLLLGVGVQVRHTEVLGHGLVEAGHQGSNRLGLVHGVMVGVIPADNMSEDSI